MYDILQCLEKHHLCCFCQNGYLGQTGQHVLGPVILACSKEEETAVWRVAVKVMISNNGPVLFSHVQV